MVATALAELRREGRIPFRWIADHTRWMRRPRTIQYLACLTGDGEIYRRALWDHSDHYVEIWIEKDALTGVITPVTEIRCAADVGEGLPLVDVPSLGAAQMAEEDRPCFVYQFGDHDPSGLDAARAIEENCARWRRTPNLFRARRRNA